jgi:hypothetical protein
LDFLAENHNDRLEDGMLYFQQQDGCSGLQILIFTHEFRGRTKRTWGALTGGWVPHDIRDAVVDFTKAWSDKAEIPLKRFISWLAVLKSKFYTWIERYGKVNEHNAPIPRDFWLESWEREAIIKFAIDNPLEGYRRLTFMMLDQNIVAVSPSSTWRVLSKAGLLQKWNQKPSLKGTGFVHWIIRTPVINMTSYRQYSILISSTLLL